MIPVFLYMLFQIPLLYVCPVTHFINPNNCIRMRYTMKTTALPSVFPAEGTFESSSIHVDLSCVTSDAVIHYTIDGSHPTTENPVYCRENGLIPVRYDGQHAAIELRAFAQAPGLAPSRKVCFTYHFASRIAQASHFAANGSCVYVPHAERMRFLPSAIKWIFQEPSICTMV